MVDIYISRLLNGKYKVIIYTYFGNYFFIVKNLSVLLSKLSHIEDFTYYESYPDCFCKILGVDKPKGF